MGDSHREEKLEGYVGNNQRCIDSRKYLSSINELLDLAPKTYYMLL